MVGQRIPGIEIRMDIHAERANLIGIEKQEEIIEQIKNQKGFAYADVIIPRCTIFF